MMEKRRLVRAIDTVATGVKRVLAGTAAEAAGRPVYRWLRCRASRGWETHNEAYDRMTVEIMDRCLRPTSNAIDVGAHQGDILRQIVQRAPHGQHFAFEPLPQFYAGLVRDFPQVTVFPLALSDTGGRTTFQHVVEHPAYSGFLKRGHYPKGADERLAEITVDADRLDAVLPANVSIAFIKIDVEGAELQVLRGATETLRAWRPLVVFEHGLGAAEYYGTTPQAVFELFTECGLQVSRLSDWLRGKRPLTRDGFIRAFRRGDFYFLAHP